MMAMIFSGLKMYEFTSAQTHHGCLGSTLIFQKGFFILARIFIQGRFMFCSTYLPELLFWHYVTSRNVVRRRSKPGLVHPSREFL